MFAKNNITFEIDNNDWEDEADAKKAYHMLEDAVLALDDDVATKLHSDLVNFQNDNGEFPELAEKLQNDVLSKIFADYYRHPDSGHNLHLISE